MSELSSPPAEAPSGPAALGEVFTSIEVSHVIVRACTVCSGPRTQREPCAQCGNLNPPVVHDLGVVSGAYKDSGLRGLWERAGRAAAELRIHHANAQATLLRRDPPNPTADAGDQT